MPKAIHGDSTQHTSVSSSYRCVRAVGRVRVRKRDILVGGVVSQRDVTACLDVDTCVGIWLEVHHLCSAAVDRQCIECLVVCQICITVNRTVCFQELCARTAVLHKGCCRNTSSDGSVVLQCCASSDGKRTNGSYTCRADILRYDTQPPKSTRSNLILLRVGRNNISLAVYTARQNIAPPLAACAQLRICRSAVNGCGLRHYIAISIYLATDIEVATDRTLHGSEVRPAAVVSTKAVCVVGRRNVSVFKGNGNVCASASVKLYGIVSSACRIAEANTSECICRSLWQNVCHRCSRIDPVCSVKFQDLVCARSRQTDIYKVCQGSNPASTAAVCTEAKCREVLVSICAYKNLQAVFGRRCIVGSDGISICVLQLEDSVEECRTDVCILRICLGEIGALCVRPGEIIPPHPCLRSNLIALNREAVERYLRVKVRNTADKLCRQQRCKVGDILQGLTAPSHVSAVYV